MYVLYYSIFSRLTFPPSNRPRPPQTDLPSSIPPTEVTTLPNGVRIASENTPGAGCNIGIFVDAGSIYEGAGAHGVSHVMQHLGFKATAHRSSFRMIRELECIGANVAATATREQMSYSVDCLKVHAAEAVELLSDAVLNPRLEDYEVEENKLKVAADIKKLAENPTGALLEAAHAVAFEGGLANPLVPSEAQLGRINGSVCRQFKAELYTGPRIVVAVSEHTTVYSCFVSSHHRSPTHSLVLLLASYRTAVSPHPTRRISPRARASTTRSSSRSPSPS